MKLQWFYGGKLFFACQVKGELTQERKDSYETAFAAFQKLFVGTVSLAVSGCQAECDCTDWQLSPLSVNGFSCSVIFIHTWLCVVGVHAKYVAVDR